MRLRGRQNMWAPFAAGVMVGVVGAVVALGTTVAARRRATHRLARRDAALAVESARLDTELDQTFPASDPLPHSHQVN